MTNDSRREIKGSRGSVMDCRIRFDMEDGQSLHGSSHEVYSRGLRSVRSFYTATALRFSSFTAFYCIRFLHSALIKGDIQKGQNLLRRGGFQTHGQWTWEDAFTA